MDKDQLVIQILKLGSIGNTIDGKTRSRSFRYGWDLALAKVIEVIEQQGRGDAVQDKILKLTKQEGEEA